MRKRILVIPDIHGRTFWKEPVSRYIKSVYRIVFLGDYLDPYENFIPENIYNNLQEIIEFKKKHIDKVVLLKGNHDEHYSCERFRELSGGSRIDNLNWDKYHKTFNEYKDLFKLVHMDEINGTPYIFSHAGLTAYWINKVNAFIWWLDNSDISLTDSNIIEMINMLDGTIEGQELLSVIGHSRSRRGETTGSVLWADIEEHQIAQGPKIYGLNRVFQVFGHTNLAVCREDMIIGDNLAMIDSQQCFMIDENISKKIVTIAEYEKIIQ